MKNEEIVRRPDRADSLRTRILADIDHAIVEWTKCYEEVFVEAIGPEGELLALVTHDELDQLVQIREAIGALHKLRKKIEDGEQAK